jgi:hypothetical protein
MAKNLSEEANLPTPKESVDRATMIEILHLTPAQAFVVNKKLPNKSTTIEGWKKLILGAKIVTKFKD